MGKLRDDDAADKYGAWSYKNRLHGTE